MRGWRYFTGSGSTGPGSFVAWSLLCIAVASLPALAADPALKGVSPPNVVVFYVDDLGYADLGVYGSPVIRTPHLDRFAAEGVRLTDYYAPAPNCSPSRAGLLTGRFPARVGLHDIVDSRSSQMRLPEAEVTLAEFLAAAGYTTFHGGKWHMTPWRKGQPDPALSHGFEVSNAPGMLAHEVVAKFDAYLTNRDDKTQPVFAYLATPEPHTPIEKKLRPEFRNVYDTEAVAEQLAALGFGGIERSQNDPRKAAAYFALVTQMDDAFGRLLAVLDKHGMRDNTLVVFASDNGPEFRSGYAFGSVDGLRGAKGYVYEGGIRVPAILRYPPLLPAGSSVTAPVGGVDLFPTVAALAGLALPAGPELDGVDVLPALRGESFARPQPLYWSIWAGNGGVQYAMRAGDWKILAETNPLAPDMPVIEHIKSSTFVRYELYNLADDPGETRDLARAEPVKLAELRERFLALHADIIEDSPTVSLEEHRFKARGAFPDSDLPRWQPPEQD